MARQQIFVATSPLGYRVSLSRDRWREIVRFKHPALAGKDRLVRRCIESPSFVRESSKSTEVHLYYLPTRLLHVCVAVAPAGPDERFVVTAYFTRNIKEGRELWTS